MFVFNALKAGFFLVQILANNVLSNAKVANLHLFVIHVIQIIFYNQQTVKNVHHHVLTV